MYLQKHDYRFTAILAAFFFLFTLMPAAEPAYAADGYLEWEDDTFHESDDNDGSIDTVLVVTLVEDDEDVQFVQVSDMEAAGLVDIDNLPAGLTAFVRATGDYTCNIYLDGTADDHEAEDSIDDLEIEFLDGAFSTGDADGIDNNSRDNLAIEFIDEDDSDYEATMEWSSKTFTETDLNWGSFTDEITVYLDIHDDDFDGFEESYDMLEDDMVDVDNLPDGLTCEIRTENATTCTIRLLGEASYHGVGDSVEDLTIEFRDDAFVDDDASEVEDSTMEDLKVVFIGNSTAAEEEDTTPPVSTGSVTAFFVLGNASYTVNGESQQMDVAPFANNERTYVPVRYLAYCLGMTDENVAWDATARTATISEGDTVVILQIGNPMMIVNGKTQTMDVVPIADYDRIFLPARFVVEAFSGSVSWDPGTSKVTIVR